MSTNMARSCLFTVHFPFAVVLKRHFKFHVFKNYHAQLHKHVLSRQHAAENKIPESQETEHEAAPENNEAVDINELKIKILDASLTFVKEHGWSEKSLALGAESVGLSVASHTLIKGGGSELVHYFNFSCNTRNENYLKEVASTSVKIDLQEFLTDALENRLRMIIPYLPKWPEAMALMALPTQLPAHTRNVLDLVDSIWHFYGDTSLDMLWYSKRIALAAAYKTSELSLIQDKSEDFSNTMEFLQKRVENVIEANSLIHMMNENGKHLLEFGSGALITARNLLGLNRWHR